MRLQTVFNFLSSAGLFFEKMKMKHENVPFLTAKCLDLWYRWLTVGFRARNNTKVNQNT